MQNKHKHNGFFCFINRYYLPTLIVIAVIVVLSIAHGHPDLYEATELENEPLMHKLIGYAVFVCEIAAGVIITLGALQAFFFFLRHLFDRKLENQIVTSETIRVRMGYRLSLALEFAVAADILRLAISPKVNDIIVLFVIILLRVLMNFFLEHDIDTIREYDLVPELRNLFKQEEPADPSKE